jgi:hypothetical protein
MDLVLVLFHSIKNKNKEKKIIRIYTIIIQQTSDLFLLYYNLNICNYVVERLSSK